MVVQYDVAAHNEWPPELLSAETDEFLFGFVFAIHVINLRTMDLSTFNSIVDWEYFFLFVCSQRFELK